MGQAIDLTGKQVAKLGYRTLIAFIDPLNVRANRLLLAAGFTQIDQAKYNEDSIQLDTVYSKTITG
jgi:RimJ/RimL family protein N-acetyltransferase